MQPIKRIPPLNPPQKEAIDKTIGKWETHITDEVKNKEAKQKLKDIAIGATAKGIPFEKILLALHLYTNVAPEGNDEISKKIKKGKTEYSISGQNKDKEVTSCIALFAEAKIEAQNSKKDEITAGNTGAAKNKLAEVSTSSDLNDQAIAEMASKLVTDIQDEKLRNQVEGRLKEFGERLRTQGKGVSAFKMLAPNMLDRFIDDAKHTLKTPKTPALQTPTPPSPVVPSKGSSPKGGVGHGGGLLAEMEAKLEKRRQSLGGPKKG